MMFTLGHDNMLNVISKEEVIKHIAADLTAEVREDSLGVTVDSCDEPHISLLHVRFFVMRDKYLGTSLVSDKQDRWGRPDYLQAHQLGKT
jgi:hypothetical protein